MTRETLRRIRITSCGCRAVDAFTEFFRRLLVALPAFRRSGLCHDLVRVAVTGLAGGLAKGRMNTLGQARSFLGMASRAPDLHHFGRVGIILDGAVAIGASQDSMHTGGVLLRVNRNVPPLTGGKARLAMTSKTRLVGGMRD